MERQQDETRAPTSRDATQRAGNSPTGGSAQPATDTAGPTVRTGLKKWLVLASCVAAVAVVVAGIFAYETAQDHLRSAAEAELLSIADLKVGQIRSWLHERLGDAGVLMTRPLVDSAVSRLLSSPTDEDRETLLAQFQFLRDWYGYADVQLVDTLGAAHLSLSDPPGRLHEEEIRAMNASFESGRPEMVGLHGQDAPHLGVVAPFFATTGEPAGAIVLSIRASDYLYPLVQSWPAPSESAETLLVQRDGDDVLFLNDLRFHEDAALALRIPVSRADLPAAMAVEGADGIVEGNDYRGVPVVAVLKPVPGTGWHLVAKIDHEEVFAPWRIQSSLIGALTLALLLVAAVFAAWLWQRRTRAQIAARNVLLERSVAERTAELEESNRELEAFAYSVSHDLRAPLRAIDGFSRILLEDHGERLDEEGHRLLNVVRRSARQMDSLITDLLEMSRVGRTEMTYSRVDMGLLVQSVYDETASEEVHNEFSFTVKPMPAAYGDATMLRLAFLNLITNAIKFTMPSSVRRIEAGGWFDGWSNTYYVKDTGVGFDSRYSDNLFKVFERLHSTDEFEGTGIGLAIVARVARRHGGRVWAESEQGKGATFYFSLPARGGQE